MKIKKLHVYLTLLVMTLFCFSANAQRVSDIEYKNLPSKVQNFIRKHFPGQIAEHAFISRVTTSPTYNVTMRNRSTFMFDNNGKWMEINGGGNSIPYSMLPKAAEKHIRVDRGNTGVHRIIRDNEGYTVWLTGDIELKFDLNGKLINTHKDSNMMR